MEGQGTAAETGVQAERGGKVVQLDLYFRKFALVHTIGFVVAMGLTAVVTFTATAYSPETDVVTRFTGGTFNPCIFFDHYPAKLVGIVSLPVWHGAIICYGMTAWLHAFASARIGAIVHATVAVSLFTLCSLCLWNIFTTELYPDERRRLHVEVSGGDKLSPDQLSAMLLHLTFYVVYLVSHLGFSWYIYRYFFSFRQGRSQLLWSVALFIGGVALFTHAASSSVSLMRGTGTWQWDELESQVQLRTLKAASSAEVDSWACVVILVYPFYVPAEVGVSLSFRSEKVSRDSGSVYPNSLVAGSLRMIALLAMLGAYIHPHWESDTSTGIPMSAALGSQPYEYLVTVFWNVAAMGMAAGISLALLHLRLREGRWPRLTVALGAGFAVTFHLSWMIVVEKVTFSWVFELAASILYPAWILAISFLKERGSIQDIWKQVAYGTVIIALAIASILHYAFCIPLAVAVCLYDLFIPTMKVFVSVSAIGNKAESYEIGA